MFSKKVIFTGRIFEVAAASEKVSLFRKLLLVLLLISAARDTNANDASAFHKGKIQPHPAVITGMSLYVSSSLGGC